MTDEAESSRAAQRHGDSSLGDADPDDVTAIVDDEEDGRERAKWVKERRLDAKRKRIRMLNELLRELDMTVYMELIVLYYLDCSFFWLAVKALVHGSLLTPIPDTTLQRPPDEPKPFLPLLVFSFAVNFILHLTYPAPSAGEDTRGFLHGGLMIDFIGQQGPSSKWRLGALDVCILLIQLVMVAVHVKRRELKKSLAKLSAGESSSSPSTANGATSDASTQDVPQVTDENAVRGQNADDEERGVLRRTDTLSDLGADPDDEEDALLPSSSDVGHADALDLLTSGQCLIGEFTLLDTLLQENKNYSAYRLTRSESGMNDMPETLRRLNTLRTRFGVGGG